MWRTSSSWRAAAALSIWKKEFGVSAERVAALDRVTQLAIAAGIDALRDAGIPLVMRYKTTSKGTQLPERWGLPDALRDDTGVIFASAFPGFDSFADEMARYYADHARREQLAMLESLRAGAAETNGDSRLVQEIDRRIDELRDCHRKRTVRLRPALPVPSLVHGTFAIRRIHRRPRPQHCKSTPPARAPRRRCRWREDWIHAGRCSRVIVVSADDITSDHLIEWMGAGFLASGAAATDEVVEDAAIPFDRRRHGMIIGMGAAALVVESADAARERGIQPICEVLCTSDGQQRLPRHSSRCPAHRPSDGGPGGQSRSAQRRFASADRAAHGFRFPRNLHARARRQRLRGDPRAAASLRRRRGSAS